LPVTLAGQPEALGVIDTGRQRFFKVRWRSIAKLTGVSVTIANTRTFAPSDLRN
jgi:hypothetical protein